MTRYVPERDVEVLVRDVLVGQLVVLSLDARVVVDDVVVVVTEGASAGSRVARDT
jgi:hypothetical protein